VAEIVEVVADKVEEIVHPDSTNEDPAKEEAPKEEAPKEETP